MNEHDDISDRLGILMYTHLDKLLPQHEDLLLVDPVIWERGP